MSGQKVVDMDIPENGMSEVLRLFVKSRSCHEEDVSEECFVCLSVVSSSAYAFL